MDGTAQPGKREICAALTSVVKKGPLKHDIDPKAFFMTLSTNFQALYQPGGALDLQMVWSALSQKHPPERLIGLFLKFEDSMSELGIPVRQPDPVGALGAEEKAQHRDAFDNTPEELPLEALESAIPPEKRANMISAIAQAVRGSSIGHLVSSTQLQYVVGAKLDELYDGTALDFGPLFQMLLEVDGVSEPAIYNAYLRLGDLLEKQGVALKPLEFSIDHATRQQVQNDVSSNPTPELYTGITPEMATPKIGEVVPRIPVAKTRDEKLAKFGLKAAKKQSPARVRGSVIAASLIIAAAGGVMVFLANPIRGLDVKMYDAALPLREAKLNGGRFIATLDLDRWKKLSVPKREKALSDLSEILGKEKRLKTAMIVNDQGVLVIFPMTSNDGRLSALLPYLHIGTPEGEKYKDLLAPPKPAGTTAKK